MVKKQKQKKKRLNTKPVMSNSSVQNENIVHHLFTLSIEHNPKTIKIKIVVSTFTAIFRTIIILVSRPTCIDVWIKDGLYSKKSNFAALSVISWLLPLL